MATNEEDVPSPQNKSEIFKCDKHAVSILKYIQALYEDQQLFDIALVAGAERVKIQAHRIILLLTSKYFRSMFRTNLKEATANEVELKDIDGDILKLIVEFLYTGSIELRRETVQGILKAADYLELPTLIVACSEFMGNRLNVSNCIGLTLYAQQYSLIELYKQSSDFACKNLENVCKEEEFLQLTSTQLKELLASDDAPVVSEELVFHSLMNWINHDKANREDQMSDLLSAVRFSSLTPKFISDNIISVCKAYDECRKLILEWIQWHLSPSYRTNISNSFNTKPRRDNMKAFVLSGADTHSLKLQTFDRGLNVWSCRELPSTNKRRSGFGAILRNGKLIITGGVCDKISLNTADCLDLMTLKWTTLPPMREARSNHTMAEVGGNLYVIGDASKNDLGFPMEMYDFSTEEWKDLAPVPLVKLETLRSTVLNGMLYISSGTNLLSYDPAENEWTHLPTTVCLPHNGFGSVGECLYSVGGFEQSCKDCVKRFNASICELKQVKGLTNARCNMSCIALNGRILACGSWKALNLEVVEEYNPETDEWTVLAPMLHKDDLYLRNSL